MSYLWLALAFLVGANVGLFVAGLLRVAAASCREAVDTAESDAAWEINDTCRRLLDWTPGTYTNLVDGLRRLEKED